MQGVQFGALLKFKIVDSARAVNVAKMSGEVFGRTLVRLVDHNGLHMNEQ